MDTTVDEMLADYYAHLYFEDPKAAETVEDDDFNIDDVAAIIGAGHHDAGPDAGPDDWEDLR